MAVYYSSVGYQRDGLNLVPSYAESEQHPSNTAIYPNQVNEMMMFIPPTSEATSIHSAAGASELIPSTQQNGFSGQGLSLSLGTEIPSTVSDPLFRYQYPGMAAMSCNTDEKNRELPFDCFGGFYNTTPREALLYPHSSVNHKEMQLNAYRYGPSGFTSNSLLHSKYLKPAQRLLDEVVNIRKVLKQNKPESIKSHGSDLRDSKEIDRRVPSNPSESTSNTSELSPSERQELQNKKSKLLSMLDEVDKRYGQYYHQMQSLISSFEMVAGTGAAKPYTSVALERISRHFRCLRDAIKTQIRVARGNLGEQETSLDDQGERIPRLRYVDHQLRQQKVFQQLGGGIRPTWRPQRGLPESSVSILRAWLFEHFLHPYPKDSEKIMLAKQTGLTRNQVANWFINARVRLWKPMIEEMYVEEFGDSETKERTESSSRSKLKAEELQESATSTAPDISARAIPNPFTSSNMVADDYHHYMGGLAGSLQDRFGNPHQFHDFVV